MNDEYSNVSSFGESECVDTLEGSIYDKEKAY